MANKLHILYKNFNGSQRIIKVSTDPNEPPTNQDAEGLIGPNKAKLTKDSIDLNGLKKYEHSNLVPSFS